MIKSKSQNYFKNILQILLKKLGICWKQPLQSTELVPIFNAIIEKIEKLGNSAVGFDFILYEETVKEVNKIDISLKTIGENIYIVSCFLCRNFNNFLLCSTFPTGIKHAELTPIHKSNDKT